MGKALFVDRNRKRWSSAARRRTPGQDKRARFRAGQLQFGTIFAGALVN